MSYFITHPFVQDLSSKDLEELKEKIALLTKKLNIAYSMGNSSVIHQLNMALESYRQEYKKKMDEQLKKYYEQVNIQRSISEPKPQ